MRGKFVKIAAALLAITMTQALWVSAQSENVTIITDDFETSTSPTSNGTYSSDLFLNDGGSGTPIICWADHMNIVDGIGYNGSKGLYMHNNVTKTTAGIYRGSWLTTREMTIASDTVAILRYKFKILKKSTYDSDINIARLASVNGATPALSPIIMGNKYFCFKEGTATVSEYEYALDEWYTVECAITAGTTNNVKAYMTNEQGEVLGQSVINAAVTNTVFARPINYWGDRCDEAEAIMDEVSFTLVRGSDYTPSIWQSTIESGEENVSRIPSFSILFDAPFKSGIECVIEDGEGYALNSSDYDFVLVGGRTVFVKFSKLLERMTSYSVKIKDADEENIIDQISFETERLHLFGASLTSFDKTDSQGTVLEPDISAPEEGYVKAVVNIDDPFSYPEFSGVVLAVLYNDSKMIWTDAVEYTAVPLNEGSGELDFILELPEEAEGAILKILILDYFCGELIPVHHGLQIG